MSLRQVFIAWLMLVSCAALGSVSTADWGPFYCRDSNLRGAERVRAFGPVFERVEGNSGDSLVAVRPLFCRARDAEADRTITDFLWPLGMLKCMGRDTYWRVLLTYGNDFDNTRDDSRNRFVAFPFVFSGKDAEGQSYFAVFPLGGTLHEYLGMDRTTFALFPLYSRAEEGSIVSHSVLWPLFNVAEGEGYKRLRLLPFYAHAVKTGQWEKRNVAWPLWSSVRYLYPDEKANAGGFILWPLFGRVDTKDEKTLMLLPPFFRWTKGKKGNRLLCPWPFIQVASGSQEKLYLWPLWGRRSTEGKDASFALWPLCWRETFERDNGKVRRLKVLPFFYSERRSPADANPGATGEGASSIHVKIWPLCAYRREGRTSRFRLLELWPPMQTPPIERNWAPLWTLYRRETLGEASEEELLWGLYRRRVEAGGAKGLSLFPLFSTQSAPEEHARRWSVLMGLFGYEREGSSRTYRMLYFMKLRRTGEDSNAKP